MKGVVIHPLSSGVEFWREDLGDAICQQFNAVSQGGQMSVGVLEISEE